MKIEKRKLKLLCPDCSEELKHGERGGWYCPVCGRMVKEQDADRIAPKYEKELVR